MSLTHFNKAILFLSVLLSPIIFAQHYIKHDLPSIHGMLLFGEEKVYLSHLPMFHNPHNYQVLLEVELPKYVKKIYIQSLKDDLIESVFTIVPEAFVLPDIAKDPKPFMAQLYKGHFERGGTPITNMAKFKIKEVIYFKQFNQNQLRPKNASYILIGNIKEQFLIHTIISKPDFDHIAKVKLEDTINIGELINLKKPHYLNLTINHENEIPLPTDVTFQAFLRGNASIKSMLKIEKTLYIEFKDLSF